jgi:hypothetical protein
MREQGAQELTTASAEIGDADPAILVQRPA